MLDLIIEIAVLFGLGSLGWLLFYLLRMPAPALLGTIAVVGALRVLGLPLPESPGFFSPLVQVVLGLYIGSKVTRETVKELKSMVLPAIIIAAWALSVVFLLGTILSRLTYLDPITAMLSSSMGGLPEMTIIALATQADLPVIIVMQAVRMILTMVLFPVILKLWVKKEEAEKNQEQSIPEASSNIETLDSRGVKENISAPDQGFLSYETLSFIKNIIISIIFATAGGWLFLALGVPAGGMVGATFFVAILSLSGRVRVVPPSNKLFGVMLLAIGLMVTDNLTAGAVEVILTGNILIPIAISTVIIFATSLGVALLIHRVSGWDFPTSFLAAAPGGFTIMVTLAVSYDKNPFRVSILHLCRLLAIKSVVPFVFMFYV